MAPEGKSQEEKLEITDYLANLTIKGIVKGSSLQSNWKMYGDSVLGSKKQQKKKILSKFLTPGKANSSKRKRIITYISCLSSEQYLIS